MTLFLAAVFLLFYNNMKKLITILFCFILPFYLFSNDPTDEYFSIIAQYYDKQDYQGTLNQLNYFIKKYPQSPLVINALQSIASAHERMGNFPQAILAYQEIMQKFPDTQHERQAHFSIGFIQLTQIKDYNLALKTYQEIYQKHNQSKYGKAALEYLVTICEKLKKYQEAIEFIDIMVDKYPNYANTYSLYLPLKARFQILQNKHRDAISTYQMLIKFLEENPGNIIKNIRQMKETAYAELANLYLRFRFLDLSARYFTLAIEHTTNFSAMSKYALLAIETFTSLGQYQEGIVFLKNVYNKISFTDENSAAVANSISVLLSRQQKVQEEFFWRLKAAAAGFSQNYSEMDKLFNKITQEYTNEQKYREALEFYLTAEKVYREIPENKKKIYIPRIRNILAKCYFFAGEIYNRMNNVSSAREYYEQVIKLFPKTTWAAAARQKLTG